MRESPFGLKSPFRLHSRYSWHDNLPGQNWKCKLDRIVMHDPHYEHTHTVLIIANSTEWFAWTDKLIDKNACTYYLWHCLTGSAFLIVELPSEVSKFIQRLLNKQALLANARQAFSGEYIFNLNLSILMIVWVLKSIAAHKVIQWASRHDTISLSMPRSLTQKIQVSLLNPCDSWSTCSHEVFISSRLI